MRSIVKIGLGMMMVAFAGHALAAGTASQAQLRNTVTVTYDSLATTGGTFSDTDSVIVTVNLLPAIPTLAYDSADTDLSTVNEGQVVNLDYTVTSNANGPDTYELVVSETPTDLNASTFTTPFPTVGFELGATTVAEAVTLTSTCFGTPSSAGVCSISTPNDNASDFVLNGLVATDKVVLTGGAVCIVDAVVDTNGGAVSEPGTYSSLDIRDCTGAPSALAVGDGIFEQTTVTFPLTITTVVTPGTNGTSLLTVNAQPEDVPAFVTLTPATTPLITVLSADLQIYKFVRNVDTSGSNPASCGAAAFSCVVVGGNTYYADGVSAQPGEDLEYIILLYNNGGDTQNVVVTDPYVNFTTYTPTSIQVLPNTTAADGAGTCLAAASGTCTVTGSLSAANADDTLATGGDFGGINTVPDPDEITVYAGAGANEVGAIGGTIDNGNVSVVRYLVTID